MNSASSAMLAALPASDARIGATALPSPYDTSRSAANSSTTGALSMRSARNDEANSPARGDAHR
jgi:hypothetical protein